MKAYPQPARDHDTRDRFFMIDSGHVIAHVDRLPFPRLSEKEKLFAAFRDLERQMRDANFDLDRELHPDSIERSWSQLMMLFQVPSVVLRFIFHVTKFSLFWYTIFYPFLVSLLHIFLVIDTGTSFVLFSLLLISLSSYCPCFTDFSIILFS